jgi:Tol biopolymer transport system component
VLLQKDLGGEVSFDSWLLGGRLSYNKVEGLSDIWALPMSRESGQAAGSPFLVSQVQGRNYSPMWSPDGSRIAYTSNRKGDAKGRFYVTRIERFQEQEFELSGSFFNPTWSPDGRRFVVIANAPGGRVFLQYELATGAVSTYLNHPLLKNGTPHGHFSPDGARFLFDGFGAPGESLGLHVFDGSSVTKIPGTEGGRPGRWSPNGKWIAFKRGDSIWLIRPDGTGLRQLPLAQGPPLPGFAWSADSRFIAYATIAPSPSAWTIDIENNTVRRIEGIERLGPQRLAWSPDGDHLAIGSTRGRYQLWVLENLLPANGGGKDGIRQARRADRPAAKKKS